MNYTRSDIILAPETQSAPLPLIARHYPQVTVLNRTLDSQDSLAVLAPIIVEASRQQQKDAPLLQEGERDSIHFIPSYNPVFWIASKGGRRDLTTYEMLSRESEQKARQVAAHFIRHSPTLTLAFILLNYYAIIPGAPTPTN